MLGRRDWQSAVNGFSGPHRNRCNFFPPQVGSFLSDHEVRSGRNSLRVLLLILSISSIFSEKNGNRGHR
jgi:hypothetical protein